jgi:hypothetical protein
MGEPRTHERAEFRRGRRATTLEPDEHRIHVRHGMEHGARHGAQHPHAAGELREDRRRPVGGRPGARGKALADFALNHGHPSSDGFKLLDRAQDDRRRDAVRQVGDHLRRRGLEAAKVHPHRVGEVQGDVLMRIGGVAQGPFEAAVDLHHVDVGDPVGEMLRKDTQPTAHFENDVLGREM